MTDLLLVNFSDEQYKTTIKSALNNFDNNTLQYKKLYKKLYEGEMTIEDENIFLTFNYKNKEKKIKLEYVGTFDYLTGLWVWSWANTGKNKLGIYSDGKIRKLLNYGLNIPLKNMIREHFINSRIVLNSNIQYDIHIALISYITKVPIILQFNNIKILNKDQTIIKIDNDLIQKNGMFEVFIPIDQIEL